MNLGRSFLLLQLLAATVLGDDVPSTICASPNNVFTVVVDLYASELGYFTFEECGDMTNPTLGLELGETYLFVQRDRSNWFHPMGFSYFPDGAHADKDELEPTITQTGSNCAETFSCPTPRYFKNGVFLGEVGTENFGLDNYEPDFFLSPDWYAGFYSVELTFDDEDYKKDFFYFCHIHEHMAGRIKLLKNGVPIVIEDDPPLGYEYESPSEFDKSCGTFGLENFQTPGNPICPDHFVCQGSEPSGLEKFSSCLDAMNCHMLDGMTTGISTNDPTVLFIHQMIPHHQNAVNMAKLLLIEGALKCDDLTDEEDQQCIMERVLRDIVNTQNHQIQQMVGYLEAFGFPDTDNCVVEIDTVSTTIEGPADYDRDNGIIAGLMIGPEQEPKSSDARVPPTAFALLLAAIFVCASLSL